MQIDNAVVSECDRELGAAPAALAIRPAIDEAPVAENGLEVIANRLDIVGGVQIIDAKYLPFLQRQGDLWTGGHL